MSRPPIVVFFLDQLRADALGAAGNGFVRTPHLDALARTSVRFEHCITNAPLCRPARITWMTGSHVHVHGIATNLRLPDGAAMPSHVRRLRDEAGYHTIVVGKTHLHTGQGHFDTHRDKLDAWGFSDARELPDAQQHWVRSAHADWLSATTKPGDLDKFDRWRDYIVNYTWESPPPDAAPWQLSLEDHLDFFCAQSAVEVIRNWAGEAPLYLSVNFPGPHPPFDAPGPFLEALNPDDPTMPQPILAQSHGPMSPVQESYARHQKVAAEDWTEQRARALRLRYYAKVMLVDHCIGQVIAALKDARLYDDAWILVTADHGEMLADHRMTGKVLLYDASIRVPLLIRPPTGVAGWLDRGTVDLMDVVATLLAIGDLPPASMGERSLVDRVLRGASAHHHKTVLLENMGYVGLRTEALTFGWHLSLGCPVELYDRRDDPDELHNLVQEPCARERLEEMVDALRCRRPLPRDLCR